MSFKSCPMVYHSAKNDQFEGFWDYPVGHFYWAVADNGDRNLWMMLPRLDGDEGSACCIPVRPHSHEGQQATWGWDGNIEKPTLTPSVFHDPHNPESPHHWHGFITAGEMKGC